MPNWLRSTLLALREMTVCGTAVAAGIVWSLVAWLIVVGPADSSWDAGNRFAAFGFIVYATGFQVSLAMVAYFFARGFARGLIGAWAWTQVGCVISAALMGAFLAIA
jgi:hypothetical protein